jgi:hypothetical protein
MKNQPDSARARRRLAQLARDRALLAVDGMKARKDDVFVRHVETLVLERRRSGDAGTVGWARTTDLLFHRQAL